MRSPRLLPDPLHQAIQLNPDRYRTLAQTDRDRDRLRQAPQFQRLPAPEDKRLE